MKLPPTDSTKYPNILTEAIINSPLGSMHVIADEKGLYLLQFVDIQGLDKEIEHLKRKTKSEIIPGKTRPIISIEHELLAYFDGKLKEFKTTLFPIGSFFQKLVWNEILNIPYGKTRSYQEESVAIGQPSAYRAVANANGANKIAIIIPCHRIIKNNGEIGGYRGGIARKKWLIEHERKNHQGIVTIKSH